MGSFVSRFGVLRIMLIILVVLMVIGGVAAAGVDDDFDWDKLPASLVPALTPMVFMVVLFDMMMSGIRRADTTDPDEALRFRDINRVYKVLILALILGWTPFIWSIVKGQF